MSRIYEIGEDCKEVMRDVRTGVSPGLKVIQNKNPNSPWPFGLQDPWGNQGFFEGSMILFWGNTNETEILARLKGAGYMIRYIG